MGALMRRFVARLLRRQADRLDERYAAHYSINVFYTGQSDRT